ncbi:MAG: 2-C-methyl-D-erythritol 4-phosphate cytidylyltransferase [Bacillota bacterium]
MTKNHALILASGIGARMGAGLPKQFLPVAGKSVLEYSIQAFQDSGYIQDINVVIHPEHRARLMEIISAGRYTKVKRILDGGPTRRDSSMIGVNALEDDDDTVLIHDAVRPFVSGRIIRECTEALQEFGAINVAVPCYDTIVEVGQGMLIKKIPPRGSLMRSQTPQGFKVGVIKEAHRRESLFGQGSEKITDDCGLVVKHKICRVHVIPGDEWNIKITYPRDLDLAEWIWGKIISARGYDLPPG